MADQETLAVYADSAEEYSKNVIRTKSLDEERDLNALTAALAPGARVLDLGCGPGHWAAAMQQAGLIVDAVDGSPEMATLAKEMFNIDVRVQSFDELTYKGPYAAVWANFSLLHAPKTDLPGLLAGIHASLEPRGYFHIGMKLGEGESRDDIGRLYAYYSEEELCARVTEAGFSVMRTRQGSGRGLSGRVDSYVIVTAHA